MPKAKSDLARYQFADAGTGRSAGGFDLSAISPGDPPRRAPRTGAVAGEGRPRNSMLESLRPGVCPPGLP